MTKKIVDYSDLTPDRQNANRGTPRGDQVLERSLRRTGAGRSIVVDKHGNVVAGNKTVQKAHEMGMRLRVVKTTGQELVVVQRTDFDLAEEAGIAREMAFADNRAGELNLSWDMEMIQRSVAAGLPMDAFWTDDEMEKLRREWAAPNPDDAPPEHPVARYADPYQTQASPAPVTGASYVDDDPYALDEEAKPDGQDDLPPSRVAKDLVKQAEELREKWGVEAGSVWHIRSATTPGGIHRLVCGDCREPDVQTAMLCGDQPVLAVHDPPYGIDILGNDMHMGKAARYPAIAGDTEPFDPAHVLGSGQVVVLWGAHHYADKLPPSGAWIVWDKRVDDTAQRDYSDAELAWVSTGGSVRIIRHRWDGFVRDSEQGETRFHPTQKPVVVIAQVINRYSTVGAVITDWYAGSGTTILAAERTGRLARCAEITPLYVACALERAERTGLIIDRA